MTRCSSEDRHPAQGLAWAAPSPVLCKLEAPRLVIRTWMLSDAGALLEAVQADRDHLLPWVSWARTEHLELASSTRYVAEQVLAASRGGAALKMHGAAILDVASGALIGGIGCHDMRSDTASAEVGYWMRRAWCGQGIATEALRHYLSWMFTPQDENGLGLRRARIYVSSANAASRTIPEKLGLRAEVMQREDYAIDGVGLTDRLGWGVMASEWDRRQHAVRVG